MRVKAEKTNTLKRITALYAVPFLLAMYFVSSIYIHHIKFSKKFKLLFIYFKMPKVKINRKLLPVKAHYFFFMAASGPMLPYLTVYGKELGISEVVMGSVLAVAPLTFFLAKPVFGFLADHFYDRRKLIFMALVITTSIFYLGLYFIPPVNIEWHYFKYQANISQIDFCDSLLNDTDPAASCNMTCPIGTKCGILKTGTDFCFINCNLTNTPPECYEKCHLNFSDNGHLFRSYEFYLFITLMMLSMIGFNVSNSISDAICFDVLGEGGEKKYGYQRVWGTVGFGITAFLGGAGMDLWAVGDANIKNYTPAFVLVFLFTCIDVFCCLKLKLPKTNMSENILKDLGKVLKNRHISVFLVFATLVGVLDGYIIYFLFWFLEDLAKVTGEIKRIKILEGLVVAAETLGGEVIFFPLSGKILKKLGYGHTFTLCFFLYALRLGLISLISDPWWVLPVEMIMQGPTYALCYTTVVAYASAISPPGTSATMQGIAAGMDDGFGYAVGSLFGGFLYKTVGGRMAFRVFSFLALICCTAHMILYKLFLSKLYGRSQSGDYSPPGEIVQMVQKN